MQEWECYQPFGAHKVGDRILAEDGAELAALYYRRVKEDKPADEEKPVKAAPPKAAAKTRKDEG